MNVVAYACSSRPNALWSAAQFDNALPKNRTECDIPLVAKVDADALAAKDAEIEKLKAGRIPSGFSIEEIKEMLSIVEQEEQTVDGGGEFGPQESTDGWYTRLLREILKNAEGE